MRIEYDVYWEESGFGPLSLCLSTRISSPQGEAFGRVGGFSWISCYLSLAGFL